MTSTMKKAPKKKFNAIAKQEPTPLVPMPADWAGTMPDKPLAVRLREYVSDAKLCATMGLDDDAWADVAPILERWVTERLKDDERTQLATFASFVEWMDSSDTHSAPASMAVVPDCFLPVADTFCQSAEALRLEFNGRIIDEPTEAPTDEPMTVAEITEMTVAVVEAIVEEALASPAPDAAGQLPLVAEPAKPAKKITALALDSSDEVSSVRLALQARAEDLEAEAKRLTGLGKQAEATSVLREAKNIKDKLMAQVTVQTAMAFNANESLPSAIARVVSGEIRSRARAALMKSAATKKGESRQDAEERQRVKLDDLEALIGNIGEQAGAIVSTILVETADGAKDAGLRERTATSSQLAREAIQRIEAQKIQ